MDETNDTSTSTTPAPAIETKSNYGLALTDDDKNAFFKAYLSDQPYVETVKLFKGKFTYTFRTLLAEERADIVKQITLDEAAGIAKNNDAYFMRLSAYRAALALVEVNGELYLPNITKDKFKPEDNDKTSTYVSARAAVILKWQDFKLASLLDEHGQFDRKVLALMEAVTSENF